MDGLDAGLGMDQRRAWLDELMSRPHLWPGQVAAVRTLAAELGVEVVIWERALDWNYEVNPWVRVERKEVDDGGVL